MSTDLFSGKWKQAAYQGRVFQIYEAQHQIGSIYPMDVGHVYHSRRSLSSRPNMLFRS